MNSILFLFICALAFQTVWELNLLRLNDRSVRESKTVPEFVARYIDQPTYARSAQYSLVKIQFRAVEFLFSSALLLIMVWAGWFGVLDRWLVRFLPSGYWQDIGYVLLLSFIFSLLSMPFSLYSTFVIEERFGFNKMTPGTWVMDRLKGLIVSFILFVPLLYGLFWFMDQAGAAWWIYAFFFMAGFQLLLFFLYPVLIAPLFNKFSDLPEGELRESLLALIQKLDFRAAGLFVMDGSKRSSHGNAYFTGWGRNKRIVLFDTLIEKLKSEQVVAVLAHELGHQKLRHNMKMLALSLLITFAGFWVLSVAVNYPPLYEAFGFSTKSYHAALVIFMFASEPFTYFLTPLFSSLSRRYEYEADRFAVDATGSDQGLSDGLLELSKNSLSNLTPHPLYSFFHYSHPTLIERLAAMRRYAEHLAGARI